MYELLIDGGLDKRYGIRVGYTFVHDITTNRTSAEALLAAIKQGTLSEIHIWDAIEDWFGLLEF